MNIFDYRAGPERSGAHPRISHLPAERAPKAEISSLMEQLRPHNGVALVYATDCLQTAQAGSAVECRLARGEGEVLWFLHIDRDNSR